MARFLARANQATKHAYFLNHSDTLMLQVSELQTRISDLDAQDRRLQQEKNDLLQRIDALQRSLEQASAEKDRLLYRYETLQDTAEKEKAELIALREMAFRLDDSYEEEPEQEVPLPADLRVLIAGGQESWQRRLSQLLPDNFSFLSREALNFDPDILHHKDWLLIYVPSISHALYYRLMAHAGSCRIGYLSRQNAQMSRKEIALILSDEK